MDFNLNSKAFLAQFRLAEMSGQQKFLAIAAHNTNGRTTHDLPTAVVRAQWRKSQLDVAYNAAFYDRAQQEGWVDPLDAKKGWFNVTDKGMEHLVALAKSDGTASSGEIQKAGGLVVVNRRATHTFDKYLRKILADAKTEVLIADAYVDDTIFDTVLDVIPPSLPVKLLYSRTMGKFGARATRFSRQYSQFAFRRYKHLHDRFMVVDNAGYVLGPSIKDAATNSPAIVVELDPNEKRLLRNFFDDLWKKAK